MITTDRNVYLAAHVRKETKEVLKKMAKETKTSMSEIVSNILEQALVEKK